MNVKGKKTAASPAVWLAGLAVLCLFLLSVAKDLGTDHAKGQEPEPESSLGRELLANIAREMGNALYGQFIPVFSFIQDQEADQLQVIQKQINSLMPFYQYSVECGQSISLQEESLSLEEILLAEAQEGETTQAGGADRAGEGETRQSSEAEEAENGGETTAENGEEEQVSLEELLRAENEAAIQASEALAANQDILGFVPHTLQNPIAMETLQSYETLVHDFYTIDQNTMAGSDQLNVSKLLEKDMTLSKESEGPQILIFHTHSQETFADSIPGDTSTSIVGVGDQLCRILTEEYGYQVLHHTGQYDVDTRDDAYSRALPAIEQVLEENPSIQVVIDLHRDQMAEETRLVMDLDGRPTARFMFFNGLSRTRKTGNISYLYNENQEDNLAFSFQMQLAAAQYYPGLTRKIYLKGYRYNMHLRPRYLLVELGAQNNTVEEAMNACDPLAHMLDLVLTGEARQTVGY